MAEYDIAFGERLAETARIVAADGLEQLDAQRTVLYLSLLSVEITLKALLEHAGIPVTEIRARCDLSVGCSLGVSPRRIGGANQTNLRGPE